MQRSSGRWRGSGDKLNTFSSSRRLKQEDSRLEAIASSLRHSKHRRLKLAGEATPRGKCRSAEARGLAYTVLAYPSRCLIIVLILEGMQTQYFNTPPK